ncbi:MAG: hypothetical protein JW967_04105 [Dehalococcoidales bacterium]|nr:hypothetical protein [Dehalococcoidales bacterium]
MVKKIKSQVKPKRQTIPKERSQKLLAKVPEEHIFWCYGGTTFRDLKEMAEGLVAMSDDVFAYHVNSEKNDFYNWVRDVIEDNELANALLRAASRLQAAECVATRITLLNRK